MVWLDYSAESRPGRLAVRTWQMSSSEAKAVPTRFGESSIASSSDTGEPGAVRTFFRGDRAVQVFVLWKDVAKKWLSSGGRGIVLRTSSGWLGLAAGLWVTVLAVRGRAYPASDVLGLGQLAGGSLLALAGAVALSRLLLHGEKNAVLQARGTVLAFGNCGSNVGPRGMGGGGHPGRDRHRGRDPHRLAVDAGPGSGECSSPIGRSRGPCGHSFNGADRGSPSPASGEGRG